MWNCAVGILTVKGRRARQGRNPRTGEALIIDPHRVVRFRVSELLFARLNQPSRRPETPKIEPSSVGGLMATRRNRQYPHWPHAAAVGPGTDKENGGSNL